MAAFSDLVSSLLEKRGITDPAEIAAFLEPDYELHTHAPFLFRDMEKAIERTFSAMEAGERVAVYADFDCDGIPGAALLADLFRKIGYDNVEVYIPHRDREGYGFHADAIRALSARGVSLVITVDVGTTARESVSLAHELGMDVIVTDHHEILGDEPEALALLNPKIAPYPYPSLCGAGVAFKFAQALLGRGRERGIVRFASVGDGWEKWLLDLVAIATIADMVPLTGENRVLARWGLAVLRKSRRKGIRALVQKLRLRQAEITEDDIAFSIAPRINAASRMDDPDLAFKLLTTEDSEEARRVAEQLESLNKSRKGVVASIVRHARETVRTRYGADDPVVVLGDPTWKPALLGLAANSIVGDRGGIVCLWGRDAEGRIKGSCRSDGTRSIIELFERSSEALTEYGGHAASGGFTVAGERVHTLHETFANAGAMLSVSDRAENGFDALVSIREIGAALFRDIARLAPFGADNPKPIFCIPSARVMSARTFGKANDHAEVQLVCPESGIKLRAFDFFRSPSDFSARPEPGASVRVVGTIERDSFRNSYALRLVDILSA